MDDDPGCWFHGEEPIPENCYRICLECGHAFTQEDLLTRHNKVVAGLEAIVEDEEMGRPTWDSRGQWIGRDLPEIPKTPETNPDLVHICPLCTHDF